MKVNILHNPDTGDRYQKWSAHSLPNSGPDACPEFIMPSDTLACYIRLNGKLFYLDDSTGEAICECYRGPLREVHNHE